jgi:transcriptional antiterminator RfaH
LNPVRASGERVESVYPESGEAPAGRQLAGELQWYAVQTKPRGESLAQISLEREGLETFYPKLKRRRTIRRVRRMVTGPLFPSYIFARFEPHRDGRLVKYANGVLRIVSFGERPAVVEDAIIETIKAHADGEVVTIQPSRLRPGDIVEIQTGPLRGLQGIFERELSDQERVVILLEVIAKGARVVLARDELERVS